MPADDSIVLLGAASTRAALPIDRLIVALRTAFASAASLPTRHHHPIPRADGDDGTLLLMPAWQGQSLGVKIATIFPGNGARGLPTVHSSYLLFDASTGVPIALLDGNEITARRTIAVSALAASFLAREDAESLLIVGAGRLGHLAASAFAEVRPIRRVAIWNRDATKAETLAARLRGEGVDASAVSSLQYAAGEADIISCATPSTEPLIHADWLRPGTHLDLIGSFTPAMRETDDACLALGKVYVDTLDALVEAGDLLGPIANGVFSVDDVQGSLADLCSGRVAGRQDAADLTVFKAVGTALADLAAAMLVQETFCAPLSGRP
jgi:ornithine cyclodeaminase/alanine dehydrogenase-like protein (mu-crystallin family)